MFKLGDYFTRFYSGKENRSKYGSIWQVTRVIKIREDSGWRKVALKEYHKPSDHTEVFMYSEAYLLGGFSSGSIKKSTCNEIFCYINSVIHENQI
jgi:hypothetical protein